MGTEFVPCPVSLAMAKDTVGMHGMRKSTDNLS